MGEKSVFCVAVDRNMARRRLEFFIMGLFFVSCFIVGENHLFKAFGKEQSLSKDLYGNLDSGQLDDICYYGS